MVVAVQQVVAGTSYASGLDLFHGCDGRDAATTGGAGDGGELPISSSCCP